MSTMVDGPICATRMCRAASEPPPTPAPNDVRGIPRSSSDLSGTPEHKRGRSRKGSLNMLLRAEPQSKSFFPCWVVPLRAFLQMDRLEKHEVLVKRGIVREWLGPESDEHLIFVSHQWLQWTYPDSDNAVQLHTLQAVLRKLLDGKANEVFASPADAQKAMGVDWHELNVCENETTWENDDFLSMVNTYFSEIVDDGAVWIDYCSIAQDNLDRLLQGVRTLPYYIENAAMFIAACPSAQHVNTCKRCNYTSYSQRGWCRFEMLCNELSPASLRPLVVQSADRGVTARNQGDFFVELQDRNSAFNGEFACCRRTCGHRDRDLVIPCDRLRIVSIAERLFMHRVSELFDEGKIVEARILTALEKKVFAGVQRDSQHCALASTAAPFGDHGQVDKVGNSPLIYFAMAGDLERCLVELEHGEDVNVTNKIGSCALHEASLFGHTALVKTLLSRKADIGAATFKKGITALHRAARAGHIDVCRALLEAKASVETKRVDSGDTALHLAAREGKLLAVKEINNAKAFSYARSAAAAHAGGVGVMKTLLVNGADSHALNAEGLTPGVIASSHGSALFHSPRLDADASAPGMGFKTEAAARSGGLVCKLAARLRRRRRSV